MPSWIDWLFTDHRLKRFASDWAVEHYPESQRPVAASICEIIIEQLGVRRSEVHPQARFIADLDAVDLDSVELIMAVEEVFKFEISDDDASRLVTVDGMIRYVLDQTTGHGATKPVDSATDAAF